MNTRELAQAISELLEDVVCIDSSPKVSKNFAALDCEDDEGNSFVIRVTQTNITEDVDDDDGYVGNIVEEGDDAEL